MSGIYIVLYEFTDFCWMDCTTNGRYCVNTDFFKQHRPCIALAATIGVLVGPPNYEVNFK